MFVLPANWKSFADSALAGLLQTIEAMAAVVDIDAPAVEAAEGIDPAPSGLDQLEALADAKDAVTEEIAARETSATLAETRKSEALARFAEAPAEEAPVEEAPAEELAAEEAPAEEVAEEAAEELAAEEAPAAEEPVEELAVETPAAPAQTAAETARKMASRRTADETPRPAAADVHAPMVATAALSGVGVDQGTVLDLDSAAAALADRAHQVRSWHGSREFDYSIHSTFGFSEDEMLGKAEDHNYSVLRSAQDKYRDEQLAIVNDEEALVASGGSCAPLAPTYNFFSVFSPQNPLERFLPTVGAPRGGIRYINPPGLGGAGAISTHDAAASAETSEYVDKNCSRVTCPSETSVTVAAISWCVTFDNLNFRVFPEQVRDFLEQVQTQHTKAKEIYYLDRIDQLATTAVDINAATAAVYGASRSIYREMRTIAHNYRKRNNMPRDAMVDMLLPDVAEEIVAIDMTNDAALGMSVMAGPGGNMLATLATKARINLGLYYYDSAESNFPGSEHAGTAAAWRDLPSTIRSYVYAPGSVVRLDGGTLDLGLVRDSALNKTNDVEMFAEQWVEIAKVGAEVNAYDHTLVAHGGAATQASTGVLLDY